MTDHANTIRNGLIPRDAHHKFCNTRRDIGRDCDCYYSLRRDGKVAHDALDALLAAHAAEVEQLRRERDEARELADATGEQAEKAERERDDAKRLLEQARAENDALRGIASKVMPCHYCGADEIAKCPSGFPGCALMDDVTYMEEGVVAALREARAEAERQRIRYGSFLDWAIGFVVVAVEADEEVGRPWLERMEYRLREERAAVAAAQEPPAEPKCSRPDCDCGGRILAHREPPAKGDDRDE